MFVVLSVTALITDLLSSVEGEKAIISEIMKCDYAYPSYSASYGYEELEGTNLVYENRVKIDEKRFDVDEEKERKRRADEVLPAISVQVYKEMNPSLFMKKVIPYSKRVVAKDSSILPVHFIVCTDLKKDIGEFGDGDQESLLWKHIKKSESHPDLYEVPCTNWGSKCYIKLHVKNEQDEPSDILVKIKQEEPSDVKHLLR